MFESPGRLLLGLVTGIVFGFLLQKGQVAKHTVILRQLLFRDWTVVKIMGTAIAVGSVGVYALAAMGTTGIDVKPAELGGVLLGAIFFGAGLAILGYCPGTTVAAAGEGKKDALMGIVGMLCGAAAFVGFFPAMERLRGAFGGWGEVTWPALTGTSPWPWILGLLAAAAALYALSRVRRPHLRARRA
jgi:uncharacterized protein